MINLEKFDQNLAVMAETFDKPLSALLIKVYQRALSDYSDDQIEHAMMTAIMSLKWFPKPVELIELIEGKSEERAILAWDSVLQAIQRHGTGESVMFEDGRAGKAIELMGGWEQLGRMLIDDLKWKQQEFLRIYRALPEMPPVTLHGRFATGNAARGYLEHIPEPIRIAAPSPLALAGGNGNGRKLLLSDPENGKAS